MAEAEEAEVAVLLLRLTVSVFATGRFTLQALTASSFAGSSIWRLHQHGGIGLASVPGTRSAVILQRMQTYAAETQRRVRFEVRIVKLSHFDSCCCWRLENIRSR